MPRRGPEVILGSRRIVAELRTPAADTHVMGPDGLTALVETLRRGGTGS